MRFSLLAFILLSIPAWADDTLVGYWAGGSSILAITESGNNLSATIIALMDPVYMADEEFGPEGTPRRDDNNPNEALRDRRLLGMELLSNYEFTGKLWEGKIYDPESGNTYSSRMELDRDGNLKMRGYIGIPLFGRSELFMSLRTCTAEMREMLVRSVQTTPECAAE